MSSTLYLKYFNRVFHKNEYNLLFRSRFFPLHILKTYCVKYARIPAGNYMFKVNNRNNRKRCEKCSKLTIKTPAG